MRTAVLHWTRRIAVILLVLTVALAGIGAAYQSIGAAADKRAAPAPGVFVTVAGHQMHLHCLDEGAPTVVLEAGATGFAQTWSWVQGQLASTTRVCSYDRAGLGWSENWGAHDGVTAARNLKALLEAAGEGAPYILIGHSLGGPLVQIFTREYPDHVIGLGFVDPSHPDQLDRFGEGIRREQEKFHGMIGTAAKLAPFGIMRATNLLGRGANGLPERDYRTARFLGSSKVHLQASHAELMAWDETMEAARALEGLGSRPVVVISAGRGMEGMPEGFLEINQEMHREIAAASTAGHHLTIPGADHFTLLMDREMALQTSEHLARLIDQVRAVGTASAAAGLEES